ncbi:MAG: 5-formyltetrahydrofolate cyclo-ligase [Sporomusaceae bacterium]|nr:5-formyltetrahydrofolate cyclo-ligase [Sporomusaceae bacterium]
MRVELLDQRRKLSKEFIFAQSSNMAQNLYNWPHYQSAKTIMLFLSMPDEPSMTNIIEHAWQQGKTVCVPHMREQFGIMDAAIINNMHDLVQGRFNLLVPNPIHLKLIDPGLIDIVVVPAVAYDDAGNRLGMGAGYYDRFIPQAPQAILIGAIWSSQIVASIPANQYDKGVQYLLKEDGIIRCNTSKEAAKYFLD